MPIFASFGAFLKPGETENIRTIQTEVNSHGSMLISGHSIARKNPKSVKIYLTMVNKYNLV